MKNLILSTIAAAALALTAGTALASDASPDNGFAVYLQDQGKAPATRSFLSGSDYDGNDHIFSNNGRDAKEFEKVQQRDSVFTPDRRAAVSLWSLRRWAVWRSVPATPPGRCRKSSARCRLLCAIH